MKINKKNYEAYFLDYIEGQLSATDKVELERFLAQNPALANELNEFEEINLIADDIEFEGKDNLKQTATPNATEELCIARLEGDLTATEAKQFDEKRANNTALNNEYKRFEKTRLHTDKSVVYSHKEELRKSGFLLIGRRKVFAAIAMAAAFALLFWVGGSLFSDDELSNTAQQIEKQKTKVTEKQDVPYPEQFERDSANNLKQIAMATIDEPDTDEDENKDKKEQKSKKKKNTKSPVNTGITINKGLQKNQHLNKEKEQPKNNENSEKITQKENKTIAAVTTAENDTLPQHIQREETPVIAALEPKQYEQTEYGEYLTLQEVVKSKLHKRIDPGVDGKVGFDDILKTTIARLSIFTGRDMRIDFKYNDNGKVSAFAFQSELFAFAKPIKRNN